MPPTDEKIDHLLQRLKQTYYNHDFLGYCGKTWGDSKEDDRQHRMMREKMVLHTLIRLENHNPGMVYIHPVGVEIVEKYGGWLNYLEQEAEEQRKREQQQEVARWERVDFWREKYLPNEDTGSEKPGHGGSN